MVNRPDDKIPPVFPPLPTCFLFPLNGHVRYMRTQAELSLADAEIAYLSCRQRIEREGGVALSSIHFTCAARPDRLEV